LVGLTLAWGLLFGCARQPAAARDAAPTRAAAPARSDSAPVTNATTPPLAASAASAAPAETSLAGDDQLPEPWRARFRGWLAAQTNPTYVAVVGNQVMSNAISIVLQRRTQIAGVCLQGPSKLELLDEGTPELTHFGDDCCPGTECVRTVDGWNLRYLALVAARSWKELSLLVPAERKLVWHVNDEGPTVRLSRKQVAAGQFREPPNCGLIYDVPSCDPVDATGNGFICRCDGGGYHVAYTWQREGNGFVLVDIAESSH
jgi:hypothetical protein